MTTLLMGLCAALFFVSPPVLLAVRFVSPTRLSWWPLVTAVALSSWFLLALGDQLIWIRDSQCEVQVVGDTIVGCPIYEYAYTYNREFGWLKGLIYLLPWLAIYGLANVLRSRRQQSGGAPPNTSLERTRDR